jgi:hypothetical protein
LSRSRLPIGAGECADGIVARDERFWTEVCNAHVSDRIGDIPLTRANAIHHTIALMCAPKPGIQHVNHQVQGNDDVPRFGMALPNGP